MAITSSLKYRQIHAELLHTIRSGQFRAGDKLPTENELAHRFGASRSTVIRALRGIEEQGFITRRQGSGSFVADVQRVDRRRKTHLGLIKSVQSGRYVESIVDQIQARLTTLLQQQGSGLVVHTVGSDDDPAAVARKLAELRVSGTFMVPVNRAATNAKVAAVFVDAGLPVVLLDADFGPSPADRSGLDVVSVENRQGGFLQTRHLLDQGVHRIIYLGVNPPASTVVDRCQGYRDAMAAYGIEVPSEWICEVSSDQITEAFVDAIINTHRPGGIVCKSDEYAALFMRHALHLGVRIPQDVRLVGFDDRPIASLLPVTLTTIRQPTAEIAEMALQLMDMRLESPARVASRVELAGELVVRQSSVS